MGHGAWGSWWLSLLHDQVGNRPGGTRGLAESALVIEEICPHTAADGCGLMLVPADGATW